MRGRVGTLIELGAGFNPILTARANIQKSAHETERIVRQGLACPVDVYPSLTGCDDMTTTWRALFFLLRRHHCCQRQEQC